MATASAHASAATLIPARAEHTPELGRICYEAFKDLQDRHRFLVDFPSVQLARQVIGLVVTRPEFYGVAAMSDGELVGSNFLTAGTPIAREQNSVVISGRAIVEAYTKRRLQRNSPTDTVPK